MVPDAAKVRALIAAARYHANDSWFTQSAHWDGCESAHWRCLLVKMADALEKSYSIAPDPAGPNA